MKLWILRPKETMPEGQGSPWEPWDDKAFGFVVRAETESDARKLANADGGAERGPVRNEYHRTGGDPWLNPEFSTCEELHPEGEAGVVMQDFRAA